MSQIELLSQYERSALGERQRLPDSYLRLPDDELDARIAAAKADVSKSNWQLTISGHYFE